MSITSFLNGVFGLTPAEPKPLTFAQARAEYLSACAGPDPHAQAQARESLQAAIARMQHAEGGAA